MSDNGGATWIASYPRSGSTWLRCLLEAYRRNGLVDINDLRICTSDAGATLMQGVSPLPATELGWRGETLIRPAALLNLFCRLTQPLLVKTHCANLELEGLPPLIPREFTERAVYIVRDPRSVILSFAKFYGFSMDKAVESMNTLDFRIGGNKMFASTMLSSWSNHVASWTGEQRYPVHVVKYEDMVSNPAGELADLLTFLEWDVDAKRIDVAVEAARLSKLRASESDDGFRENVRKEHGTFFNAGGSRWRDELGPRWIAQIEADHGEVMRPLGYLEADDESKEVGQGKVARIS